MIRKKGIKKENVGGGTWGSWTREEEYCMWMVGVRMRLLNVEEGN